MARKLSKTSIFTADDARDRFDELASRVKRASGETRYRLSLSEAMRIAFDAALDVWEGVDFDGLDDKLEGNIGDDATAVVEREMRHRLHGLKR